MKKLLILLLFTYLAFPLTAQNTSTQTQYPVVLVHGLFGFDNLLGVDYFYRVPQTLQQGGTQVYVAEVSSAHSSEVRGEQLLQQVEVILALTGAQKVNLIGHSQGAQTIRYVASVAPEKVASATSVGGVNWGSQFADVVRGSMAQGSTSEAVTAHLVNAFAGLINLLSGKSQLPSDSLQALSVLTTEGSVAFNQRYPEGVPRTYCAQGDMLADNGVYYFSWSGNKALTNFFDPSDALLGILGSVFNESNDGLVSACSSHLGKVINSRYRMNHLDQVNQLVGMHHWFETDPLSVYRSHVKRLKALGL